MRMAGWDGGLGGGGSAWVGVGLGAQGWIEGAPGACEDAQAAVTWSRGAAHLTAALSAPRPRNLDARRGGPPFGYLSLSLKPAAFR